MKIPAVLPPQAAAAARSAVNTQTLSGAPLLSPFPGKGLRVKDSVTSGVSSSANGGANGGCSSLGISNISGSFGTSLPDPGGMAGPCKDSESLSPSPIRGEGPPSPLMGAELQECQSLWVKIELNLLSRVPGSGARSGSGDRPRGPVTDRGGGGTSEGRDRVAPQREREKEWQGARERVKSARGERAEVEEGERAGEREERERLVTLLGERERPAVRDKVLEEAGGPEQNQQRSNGKHRRQAAAAGGGGTPAERHISKRKYKVENQHHHQHSANDARH